MKSAPTPVVTCTIYFKDKFLVIRRHDKAKKFGGTWGFPGGKIEQGETVAGALIREVKEETGLNLKDKIFLADSYYYGDSIGIHFIVFATSNSVKCEPGVDHQWLGSLKELKELHRIPGIDFHIVQANKFKIKKSSPLSLADLDYIPSKYIN